jgi:hypothetical protein
MSKVELIGKPTALSVLESQRSNTLYANGGDQVVGINASLSKL